MNELILFIQKCCYIGSFLKFLFRLDKNCVLIEIFNKKPSLKLARKIKPLLFHIYFNIFSNRSCYNWRLLNFQLQKPCCIWYTDLDLSLDLFTYGIFWKIFPHYTKSKSNVSKLNHLKGLSSYLDALARMFCKGELQNSWVNPLL